MAMEDGGRPLLPQGQLEYQCRPASWNAPKAGCPNKPADLGNCSSQDKLSTGDERQARWSWVLNMKPRKRKDSSREEAVPQQ